MTTICYIWCTASFRTTVMCQFTGIVIVGSGKPQDNLWYPFPNSQT